MTNAPRTDIHRPAELVTEDYEYLWAFDNQQPGVLVNVDMDWWRSITNWDPALASRGTHQCHHCGAHIRYVGLLRHVPTGYAIAVGETCMENRFERATADFQRLRKQAQLDREQQRIKTMAAEFIEGFDGDQNLALRRETDLNAEFGILEDSYEFRTMTDIRSKLWKYGSISEKQVAFFFSLLEKGRGMLAKRAAIAAERAAEVKCPAPNGRQIIEGVVISRKWKDSDYGGAFKLTVKCETPQGRFLVWMSEPARNEVERGDVIRVTVSLTPSDNDPSFAFGKRPAKLEVIGRLADLSQLEDSLAD